MCLPRLVTEMKRMVPSPMTRMGQPRNTPLALVVICLGLGACGIEGGGLVVRGADGGEVTHADGAIAPADAAVAVDLGTTVEPSPRADAAVVIIADAAV